MNRVARSLFWSQRAMNRTITLAVLLVTITPALGQHPRDPSDVKRFDRQELKDAASKTPVDGRWVMPASLLDDDTAQACKIAFDSKRRISVTLQTSYELGSPELESFRKNAGTWLKNVEIVHPKSSNRKGNEQDFTNGTIDVLLLNEKSLQDKWAKKVKADTGKIIISK